MDLATIVLSGLMLGSTVADVETTLRFPPGIYETNPVASSFSHSRPALYAYTITLQTGIGVLSYKMRHWSKDRRAWRVYRVIGWVLPAFTIAVQSVAAIHNHNSR